MNAAVKIKLVILIVAQNTLRVFLPENKLPWTYFIPGSDLELVVEKFFTTSLRTTVKNYYIEQLYTTSSKEDVSVVYFILVEKSETQNWQNVITVNKENEDFQIIHYALQRLRWKIEYTNLVYSLLPNEFTLSELQKTYEIILDKTLDKRNFRKKILSLNFLDRTGKKRIEAARPAELYKFKDKKPTIVKVFS